MRLDRQANLARLTNLVLPGGGLIMLGCAWSGALIALVFAACANFAVGASLIFPDDVPGWLAGLAVGMAAGTYFGAQIRFLVTVRMIEHRRAFELRRRTLHEVLVLLRRGEYGPAHERIRVLAHLADSDLLVAYRFAQVLTGTDDPAEAGRAWHRVRGLDHHKIYRQDMEAHRHLWDRPTSAPGGGADTLPDPT